MASSTTIHTSQWSSTLKRLPSFSRKARKSHGPGSKVVTVSLHRCSSKSRPLAPRPRNDSTASCSSWSSSTSTLDGTSSTSTSKVRDYPSRCANMVITGVSALLLMPLPFLDNMKGEKSAKKDAPSESGSLKRVLSRRPQKDRRRRNSRVLPEVPMPDEPAEPVVPFRRGSACPIRDSPPPIESRTVRFILPPPKFAPPIGRRWDEEPAWSDYMVCAIRVLKELLD
ncbi:hypothetical protein B0H13DRAFT_1907777 [Mycena leptocephala]|nr:hypothetical protein B0H13DRAFT_1907777 [Mycena leptocephala]